MVGFYDVSDGFVGGVGDGAKELRKDIGRHFGIGIVDVFVEELVGQKFGFLKAFPTPFAGDLETQIPETFVLDGIGFDGGESGASDVLTPGGGAFGPIVA